VLLKAQFHNDSLTNLFPKPHIYLKTNPLCMLQGPIIFTSEFRLSAERMTAKKQSFQITAGYLGKGAYLYLFESMQNSNYEFKVNGARFGLEYRIYLFDKNNPKPEGMYIAPAFSYSYAKITDAYSSSRNEYIQATFINYTIKGGYQLIRNKLALDFFYGLGYKDNTWTMNQNQSFSVLPNNDFELFPGNLKLILGFNVGIVF
jgi:hypothetical protein